jgi:esterase/lipase superfamily enzyme
VFIHGYNTNWLNACRAAANLKKAYAHLNPNVFLMSWPSDGIMGPKNIKEYHDDRDDAKNSGKALYRGLMKLRDFLADDDAPPCGQKIVLFMHSMGNYAFRHALQAIIDDTPPKDKLPRLFDHIISAAADEDNDAFLMPEKWKRIGELCGDMTLYINKNDKALWGSNLTKGNPERMGNRGPSMPFDIPHNVTVVDVSKLDPLLDLVGHGYYDTWEKVIADITQVINGVEPHEVQGRNAIPMKNKYTLG